MKKEIKKKPKRESKVEQRSRENKEFAKARATFYKSENDLLEKNSEFLYDEGYIEDKYTGEVKSCGLTKYIVWVKTKADAEKLEKAILNEIKKAETKVKNNPKFILNRSIKIFNASTISLKIKQSYQTEKGITLNGLKKYIQFEVDSQKNVPVEYRNIYVDESILKLLETPKFKNVKSFTKRAFTGHKYEVAYFDEEKQKTITQGLGNIVIVVSNKKPNFIRGSRPRKTRNDQRCAILQTSEKVCWYAD